MSAIARVREWLEWHSVRAHIAAPIWLRVPKKRRWSIVYWLDRSQKRCWSSLVDAALAYPEDDACDVHVPGLLDEQATRCASVCDFMHTTHTGEHDCSCYCGKFQFIASAGALERNAAVVPQNGGAS